MTGKLPSVLVTGATGLVGSRLVGLLEGKWEVYALARRAASIASLPANRRISVDLSGRWEESALPSRLDAVAHLAQADDYRRFPEGAEAMQRINVECTARLLEHGRRVGVRSFVLASSGGICAKSVEPITEDAPVALSNDGPIAYYLRTKRAAEILAEPYSSLMGVNILRFFFIYGSGQQVPMLFPRLAESIAGGRPIDLDGGEGIRLNPVHADDAAKSVASALNLDDSRLVNVAGPEVVSMRSIADTIGSLVKREPIFRINRPGTQTHLVASIDRMTRDLGAPLVCVEDGLKEMLR